MKPIKPNDTFQKHIKDTMTADPETGKIYRRDAKGKMVERVGYTHQLGYTALSVSINNETYNTLAHRLAFFLYHGYWSELEIDHIDGNKKNNSKSNLRECTHQQNRQNSMKRTLKPTKMNRPQSMYKGVRYDCPSPRPWQAHVGEVYLGKFATPREAAMAYNEAALKLWGEFARLNVIEEDDKETNQ